MLRCSPEVAQSLGITSLALPATTEAAKPAGGCGCGGSCGGAKPHTHGAGLTFVVGALVGAIIVLAVKA